MVWPRSGEAATPEQPVVLLQAFLDGVIWLSLEELGQQADPDSWLILLTLPVRPEAELKRSTQKVLERHPELLSAVLSMRFERLPTLTTEELMVFAGIPTDQLLHTRAAQDLLDWSREEGEAKVTLRLLNRRCGPLSEVTTARIQALQQVAERSRENTEAAATSTGVLSAKGLVRSRYGDGNRNGCSSASAGSPGLVNPAAPDLIHHELRR